MNSLRSQITALTISAVLICTVLIGAISILSMKAQGDESARLLLNEVCQEKCENIDNYLGTIEESAETVSRFVYDSTDTAVLEDTGVIGASGMGVSKEGDAKAGDAENGNAKDAAAEAGSAKGAAAEAGSAKDAAAEAAAAGSDGAKAGGSEGVKARRVFDIPSRTPKQREKLDDYLGEQVEEVRLLLGSIAENENSIYSYYYRINPEFGGKNQGFWYAYHRGGFVEKELTDISRYEADDMEHVGWYYEPLRRDRPFWLDPYKNANLGELVVSYVIPVYKSATFIGVVGIDIRCDSLTEKVGGLKIMRSGYAFLTDADGKIIYHPKEESGTRIGSVSGKLEAIGTEKESSELVVYSYDDKKKKAAWQTLCDGLKLVVTVPAEEVETGWRSLSVVILMFGLMLLGCFGLITVVMTHRITQPLDRLVRASRQITAGDYDVRLAYQGEDEVGVLTAAFSQMANQMKGFIQDLNSRAYKDALTSVSNKGAFDRYMGDLSGKLRDAEPERQPRFAMAVFDCNDLKRINDTYGHDKGDVYIQTGCRLICKVFAHSPVFRVGGDEFAVILKGEDFENREALEEEFDRRAEKICGEARDPWEEIRMARGMAVYDPEEDTGVESVLRRADEAMYRDKRETKTGDLRKT